MMKKLLFVFLAVWMALIPMGRVFASQESPSVEYIKGPDGQRYILERTKEITQDTGTEATGCKTYTQGITYKNLIGLKLWKYQWSINWCYDGSVITSLNRWNYVTIYAPFWNFLGNISNQTSGGVGQSSFWSYAQGDMCLVNYNPDGTTGCVAHIYPWVQQSVFGDGSYSGSSGD